MAGPGRLIIIAGLPGTGKSTLAKRLADETGGTIYSPDEWMSALGISLWDGDARDAIERLQWRQAQDILHLGGTCIIEWGTWARVERDALRDGARALGARVELHFLDAPLEILHKRLTERGREDPPIALGQLATYSAAIEPPSAEEFSLYDSTAEDAP